MKTKIIAIANWKGGVGKTTSVASLGAALAMKGYKVLCIDLDAQMNLTYALTGKEDQEESVYHALVNDERLPVVNVSTNLDVVPASIELARAEIDLSTKIAREGILKSLIEEISDRYNFIIIDCPPSLGIVTTNALVAADEVFIPLTAEAFPLKGLKMLDDVISEVQRRINHKLKLGGVFFTRFNNRKLNKEVEKIIIARYGDCVFSTKIRENIALAESPLSATPIFDYSPESNGAKDYNSLADEVLSRADINYF